MTNPSPNVSELIELIEKSEEIPRHPEYLYNFGQKYAEIRDKYLKEGQSEKAEYIQLLINALNVSIETDGTIKPFMSGTTEDGEEWQSPNINKFDKPFIESLRRELAKDINPFFKARYLDLIFILDRDKESGKKAIEAYLSLADIYKQKDLEDEDKTKHHGLSVSKFLCRAYVIALSVNHNITEIKNVLLETLLSFNSKSSSKNRISYDIIHILVKNDPGILKKNELEDLLKIAKERSQILLEDKNSSFAKSFWELQSIVEDLLKVEREEHHWEHKEAELFLEQAKEEKNALGKVILYEKAFQIYSGIGDIESAKKVQALHIQVSPDVKLHKHEVTIDMSEMINLANEYASDLSGRNPKEILVELSNLEANFPNLISKITESDSFLEKICSFHSIDEFGNITNSDLSEADQKKLKEFQDIQFMLDQYGIFYSNIVNSLFNKGSLKSEDIIKFIEDSWTSSDKRKEALGSKYYSSMDWVRLLMPALRQMLDFYTIKESYEGESRDRLILATDSLVPKIEGLVRESFLLLGAPIFDLVPDDSGKVKKVPRTLGTYMFGNQTKKVRKKLIPSKKERFLICFTLLDVSQVGASSNLRNRIAHSKNTPGQYTDGNLVLVFMIMLRFLAWNFKTKQPPENLINH